MADDLRKQVGVILRFPIVVLLGVIWIVFFWWWIIGISIIFNLLVLILVPAIYPIAYAVVWLYLAFLNSNDPVLPYYWHNYPDICFKGMGNAFTLGFHILHKWMLEGFD